MEGLGHGGACLGGRASSSHSLSLAWQVGWLFVFSSTLLDGFETRPGINETEKGKHEPLIAFLYMESGLH